MTLLSQLAPNALTDQDREITQEAGDVPNTFVPGRNLLFFSFAGVLARQIEAKHIITGVSETDFSGYPDCRDDFVKSLNVTLNLAMEESLVIHTPLMWLDKSEVWDRSEQLGRIVYVQEITLSCYNCIPASGCGTCPSCELLASGLEKYLQN